VAIRRFSTADLTGRKGSSVIGGYGWGWSEMDSIQTVSLASPSSSVGFSSIPQTYQHLQVRVSARGTNASTTGWGFMKMNAQATGTSHYIQGTGSATDAFAYVNNGAPLSFIYPQANAAANIYGGVVVEILDYAITTKNKVGRFVWGCDLNGSGNVGQSSLLLTSTSAVTQVTFHSWDGPTFATGSVFALYGIKG